MVRMSVLVVLVLGVLAIAVAPPVRLVKLTAEQAGEIAKLQQGLGKAAEEGKFEEAEKLAKEIAELREKWQGKGNWETIDARYEIDEWTRLCKVAMKDRADVVMARKENIEGLELDSRGRYKEALKKLEKALKIRKAVLGEQHPDTATSYNSVAFCLDSQAEHAKALHLYEKALQIRKIALGEQHPDTATSYNNVASCLDSQAEHAKALPLYEKSLQIRKSVLGERHPHTATIINNVAYCLSSQGEHTKTLPLFETALQIRKAAFGDLHPTTAESYNNVAACLNEQGEHAKALPLFEKALQISKAFLGERHPHTATIINNVAACLDSQGELAKALPLHERALEIRKAFLGERHPDTAASYNNVAYCLQLQGEHSKALPLFEKALQIRKTVLGERHPDTAAVYNNMALCLQSQGEFAKALPLFEKALQISKAFLGERHPHTATSYNNVAACLGSQGEFAKALPLHEKALQISKSVLGDRHPGTARIYNYVAFCHHHLGNLALADKHWRAAILGNEWSRLSAADSGFSRVSFNPNDFSPRQGLTAYTFAKDPREAWQHAESNLSRGLLDDLASDTATSEESQLHAGIEAINNQLVPLLSKNDLPKDQATRRDSLLAQRKKFEDRGDTLLVQRTQARVASLADVQAQLAPTDALIFWIDSPPIQSHLGCIVRHTGDPIWVTLPSLNKTWTKDDDTLAARAFATLTTANNDRAKLLADLTKQRITPLEPHLKDTKRLLVIPAGVMSKFPIETLTDKYAISYIPSASVFARLKTKPRSLATNSALILADPVFSDKPAPLPPTHGILIVGVLPDGAAAKAKPKLQAGDVLLKYAEKDINSLDDLRKAISKENTKVVVWREGKQHTADIAGGLLGANLDTRPITTAFADWNKSSSLVALNRSTKLDQLPGTRLEARILANMVKDPLVLLGSDANEEKLESLAELGQLSKYRIVHIATHGEANATRAEESALMLARDRISTRLSDQENRALAGKKPIDGRLTVQTIRRTWKLDADLVTLSACETGLGKETSRDGMLGFAQALIEKGARSVVLSRWKVDDAATALLMSRFYENLTGKGDAKSAMKRAEALREAKTWLRNLSSEESKAKLSKLFGGVPVGERGPVVKGVKVTEAKAGEKPYADAYYWAAFVLVGDPD